MSAFLSVGKRTDQRQAWSGSGGKVVYNVEVERLGIPWLLDDEVPEMLKPKRGKQSGRW